MALNKRKILDAARKHAQKGAKAKALKEYNKLLKVDPGDAKLLLEVGDAYRRWGQSEEAISQYSKVACQYRQDGFDARAVAVFKQILNLDPKHYSAYVELGELYQRMGLDSEAVASLQMAADGYHKEGRKTEALDLLRQMAALDPSNTTSRLKVAELLRQEGMEDDAVAEYQAVAAELQGQQEREQLIVVHDRILELRPNHLETLSAQVHLLMAAGELDRAEPMAVRALNAANDPAQYELLIDLYAQMGHDAKLADATRGLAKLYRDRGDEDKARELMQRLPAEDVVAPDARLAVDLSEAEEPMLEDEELLDDPFLAVDDDFESIASASATAAASISADAASSAGPAVEEIRLEASEELSADSAVVDSSIPLPEGDPDQLLAEASVYLRYGKREQAIASLKAVLAQLPDHRAAHEKLGEAFAEGGQNSEAVQAWLRAAEQARGEADGPGLEVLRDRIAALDPGLAAQVQSLDADSSSSSSPGNSAAAIPEIGMDATETESLGVELELDVEVDLNLDDAIDEVADSETNSGFEFENPDVDEEFEIDLTDDSAVFEETQTSERGSSDAGDASGEGASLELAGESEFEPDASVADVESEFVDNENSDFEDDGSIEFEIEPDDLSADEPIVESPEEVAVHGIDLEASGIATEKSARSDAVLDMNVDEEIEEAEFYVAQDMFDEAEAIVIRVLAGLPDHDRALALMDEIQAARGDSNSGSGIEITQPQIESTPRSDEDSPDEALDPEITDVGEATAETADPPPVAFARVAASVDELQHSAEGSLEDDEETLSEPVPGSDETSDGGLEDPIAVDTPAEMEPVAVASADADETFDLREALADVLSEDAAARPAETSGVLSTVDDGFESIFSDFKKGVSEALGEGDFETRYDLGIAYREMGLFEDAIGEFRVCLGSAERRFDSLYLMGLSARDLGRWEDAVNHLEQALALPEIPEARLAGVYFDLSISQEGSQDMSRALASIRRVLELDADFPGAAARLATLEVGESALPEIGNPGEQYESFDDLFDDEEGDESGDEQIIETVPVEAFESFDDVVSEAEADLSEPKVAEETTHPGESRKTGRKKISFV